MASKNPIEVDQRNEDLQKITEDVTFALCISVQTPGQLAL